MAKTLVTLNTSPSWTLTTLNTSPSWSSVTLNASPSWTSVALNTSPSWNGVVLDTSTDWMLPGSWKSVTINWENETRTYKQVGLLGKDSD
jgi:hypothetical protein